MYLTTPLSLQCEADVCTLEVALKEVETAKTSYEQQNRRLTQQLRDAQLVQFKSLTLYQILQCMYVYMLVE